MVFTHFQPFQGGFVSRFPRTEAEIAALALLVMEALGQPADDFPSPPVPSSKLQAKLDAYNAAQAATSPPRRRSASSTPSKTRRSRTR